MEGYAVKPETEAIFMQLYKYLNNLLEIPVVLILFLAGVVLVLYGIIDTMLSKYHGLRDR